MTYDFQDSDFLISSAADASLPDGDPNARWKFNPHLYKVKTGKTTGKFGEELVAKLYDGIRENRDGYDVRVEDDKIEVKTSFLTKTNDYWMNQIYYEKDGFAKDWTHLVFVCIGLNKITVWECERPDQSVFSKASSANGFQWRGKLKHMPDCFHLVAELEV